MRCYTIGGQTLLEAGANQTSRFLQRDKQNNHFGLGNIFEIIHFQS